MLYLDQIVRYIGYPEFGPDPKFREHTGFDGKLGLSAIVRQYDPVSTIVTLQFAGWNGTWNGGDTLHCHEAFVEVVEGMTTKWEFEAPMNEREVGAEPEEEVTPEQDLAEWWEDLAHEEVSGLLAKMREYGGAGRSNDLIQIGEKLISAGVSKPDGLDDTDEYAAELGIYFYIEGKLARWAAAVAEGRAVSDDTLHDIGIYVRMAQRIRAVGGWPV